MVEPRDELERAMARALRVMARETRKLVEGGGSGAELFQALDHYFHFYNHRRPHQALDYRTPADLFPRRSIRKGSSP